ncbi:BgtTE-56094 [Blumeria graminis f. sp. tritici]|uniref:BgtTE-56094 n=1 Tax=Blumeria graminis f. sp. tritici TaxID=62690 RepID=A0A9X9MKZ2_BLUGR|nr:BgtTE-56094 [Blumeria graminis f. sp. tritici]
MARRLSFLALKYWVLAEDQCSAIPLCSTSDLTTALACDIQEKWVEKKVAGIVTVNVQGAFDGIQKGRLCYRLRNQGWPSDVVGWVASFMEQRESIITIEDTTSPPFQTHCGLPQGSTVSPILFLLAMEKALRLSTGRFGYADDIVLFASASFLDECARKLQEKLDSTIA